MNKFSDSELRLKAIFDAAVDGIIIIDHKGLMEKVNQSTCRLFGYKPEEMLGQNVSMLMPKPHKENHDEYIQNYQKTNHAKIIGIGREVSGKKKNGQEFPFWLAVIEVKLEERVIYTGFIHDLTEIKQAEYRLKSLNEELEKKVIQRTYELEKVVNQLLSVNRKLEDEISNKIKIQNKLKEREHALEKSLAKERELGELKSRFVSMASHEFRTPLSTILSSVSLIGRYTDGNQQPNRDKHITKIKAGVTHLTGILNDFLSMNKLEEGKVNIHPESFDADILCREVVDELRSILKGSQQIVCENEIKVPLINSDRKILKNTLINLISNAIKYSNDDGIITCKLSTAAEFIKFEVTDTGIGIPEDEQKHLFDRFFRASNVTNIEGTGLGLNIVKKYLEILGGEITFKSKIYSGSTFTVRVPNRDYSK